MKETFRAIRSARYLTFVAALFFFVAAVANAGSESVLRLDAERTTINFTLGDVLHTVRGTFHLKRGELHLDPISRKLTGEIVIDARSGQSGNGMRDRKMQREILESDRFSEISFRPDRVDGEVTPQGKSAVRVHGIFNIHGTDHELNVPAEVQMAPGYWTAIVHFAVPYVAWGMKNPSTLFLRVSESVDIDITASGTMSAP
jgi:polyisoprenoid-binding protein YceI